MYATDGSEATTGEAGTKADAASDDAAKANAAGTADADSAEKAETAAASGESSAKAPATQAASQASASRGSGSSASKGSGGGSASSSTGAKPAASSGSSSSSGSGSGSSSSSSSSSSQSQAPAHQHSWSPVYRTETTYEDVWVSNYVYTMHERYWIITNSGKVGPFDSESAADAWVWADVDAGGQGGSLLDDCYETKEDQGHYETKATGTKQVLDHYECSCGATK